MAILLAFLALILGIVFGVVLNWSRFCAWLAFHDWQNGDDSRRLMALMLILGLAVTGTQLVALFAGVNLTTSLILVPAFSWTGAMLGGAAFGIGMVLAKGDPLKHVQKFASGHGSSLIILFWTVFSFAILSTGLLGPLREFASAATWIDLSQAVTTQGLPDLVGAGGVDGEYVSAIAGGVFFTCFALPALLNKRFRSTGRLFVGSIILGLIIPLIWWISAPGSDGIAGSVHAHALNPAADIAMMLSSLGGGRPVDSIACFMLGLVLGCLLHAVMSGNLRKNLNQHQKIGMRGFIGSLAMGGGAAFAGGGIWGAGISGVSVLAIGSISALIAMILGATIGTRMIDGEDDRKKASPLPGSRKASAELARRVAKAKKAERQRTEEDVEVVVEASFAAPTPKTTVVQRPRKKKSKPDAEPKGLIPDDQDK